MLIGNHRDAWVVGSVDPNSGTAALLEVAKGLGELLKAGWRPRRTILLTSWDGEEEGMLGSSEYAEDNESVFYNSAVAYVNVDSAVSGGSVVRFSATPNLDWAVREAAMRAIHPYDADSTLYDYWKETNSRIAGEYLRRFAPSKYDPLRSISYIDPPRLGRVGGEGTDYAAYLHHMGIPTVNAGMSGTRGYPVYHSAYDNFRWMAKFGDPGFHRHRSMAQWYGSIALILADSDVLPLDYENYASELSVYVFELSSRMRELGDNVTDISPLVESVRVMQNVASNIHAAPAPTRWLELRQLNDKLMMAERGFLLPEGLNGPAEGVIPGESFERKWERHAVYAPLVDNNYGTSFFPAIFDALEAAVRGTIPMNEVQREVWRVARAIFDVAKELQVRRATHAETRVHSLSLSLSLSRTRAYAQERHDV